MKSEEISLGACGGRILTGDGYRFTQDSVLLANLLRVGSRDRLLDLGCGGGVIGVLALLKKGVREVVGVEKEESTAALAVRNVTLNGLSDRMRVVCADVANAPELLGRESFDKVVANPPYYDFDDGCFCREAASKRESGDTLSTFIAAGAACLRYGGDFFIVHKAARLADVTERFRKNGLEPKRLTLIFPRPHVSADTFVMAARKGGGKGIEADALFVRDGNGNPTPEFEALYGNG